MILPGVPRPGAALLFSRLVTAKNKAFALSN
jgi:hypothetical protein